MQNKLKAFQYFEMTDSINKMKKMKKQILFQPISCTNTRCHGSQITQWKVENEHASYCSLDSFKKAENFLRDFYKSKNRYLLLNAKA